MSETKQRRISGVLNVFTFLTRDGSWSKGRGMPATFSQNRIQQETGMPLDLPWRLTPSALEK